MHGYCYTSRISHLSKNHQVHNVMVIWSTEFCFVVVVVGWVLGGIGFWVSPRRRGERGARTD